MFPERTFGIQNGHMVPRYSGHIKHEERKYKNRMNLEMLQERLKQNHYR